MSLDFGSPVIKFILWSPSKITSSKPVSIIWFDSGLSQFWFSIIISFLGNSISSSFSNNEIGIVTDASSIGFELRENSILTWSPDSLDVKSFSIRFIITEAKSLSWLIKFSGAMSYGFNWL